MTLSNLTASSKKVLNSSDKAKSSDIIRLFFSMLICEKTVFIRQQEFLSFSKSFYCLKRFSYLRTHNIFFSPFCIIYYKSFCVFYIVWLELRPIHNRFPQCFCNVWSMIRSKKFLSQWSILVQHFNESSFKWFLVRKAFT